MARHTTEFLTLRARLTDLARTLPAPPEAPTYAHSPKDFDQMSAFVVLTHAACEEFMELRALSVATEAKDAFDRGDQLGRVGKHLCVFPFVSVPNDTSDLDKMSKVYGLSGFGVHATARFLSSNRQDVEKLLQVGFKRYSKLVKDNHGANFKYQFKILSLIGVDLNVLGANFHSRISQLADYRGKAAHAQIVAVNVTHTSSTLATWPADLIEGYRRLDLELKALSAKIN